MHARREHGAKQRHAAITKARRPAAHAAPIDTRTHAIFVVLTRCRRWTRLARPPGTTKALSASCPVRRSRLGRALAAHCLTCTAAPLSAPTLLDLEGLEKKVNKLRRKRVGFADAPPPPGALEAAESEEAEKLSDEAALAGGLRRRLRGVRECARDASQHVVCRVICVHAAHDLTRCCHIVIRNLLMTLRTSRRSRRARSLTTASSRRTLRWRAAPPRGGSGKRLHRRLHRRILQQSCL